MTALWDRAAALVLLLFAIYTVAAARDMSYMQGRAPGPGFAPFWMGLGLAAASLVILFRRPGGAAPDGNTTPVSSRPGHASTLFLVAGVTIIAIALIEPLGMIAALALLLLGLVRVFGASWRTAGLTAVGLPLALYILFGLWLKVPLPRGPWGF